MTKLKDIEAVTEEWEKKQLTCEWLAQRPGLNRLEHSNISLETMHYIEKLEEQVKPSVWTTKKPSKPGWYWWRSDSKKDPLVVNVYRLSRIWCCSFPDVEPVPINSAGGEWASEPEKEPEEAT